MGLYPLDLVLAASLAWAALFVGALPARLLREPVFARLAAYCGGAWMLVALLAPAAVIHYYVVIGALFFYAWRQLRHDLALSGKGWFIVAAGLGISLGVVLIFAATPGSFFEGLLVQQICLVAAIYFGGAVIGLAATLYFFTRREATDAGIPPGLVAGLARLLFTLTVARALVATAYPILVTPEVESVITKALARSVSLLLLVLSPTLAWLAQRRARSPAPSTSGPLLLALGVIGLLAECLARL